MSKRVHIVEDECIGCGSCSDICPEVFELDEAAGIAKVINSEGGPENLVQEAVEACPVECIHWEE